MNEVAASEPLAVSSFEEMVIKVAKLSYLNKDYLLFYRGQRSDHKNAAGNSSFYPSIYRTQKEKLSPQLLEHRFKILDQASKILLHKFQSVHAESSKELRNRKYIRWSILQHYEVCETPLLDLTQSIRVACSFALSHGNNDGLFFVFALPYITNRISVNSEQDIVNVRLISICPPEALRPYFQEGYLVGTDDVTTEYDDRSSLDFKHRLVAKFRLDNTKGTFWGDQDSLERYLQPTNDSVDQLCKEIIVEIADRNNIEAMFPGKWLNEYVLKDGRTGQETVEVKNRNEYYANGKHMFNLQEITVDKTEGVIKFRKVGVGDAKRKAWNSLRIKDERTYIGTEPSGTKITYTRIE